MIGIYGNDKTSRLPMAYRGLTINDDTYPVGIIAINHQYDAVTEPLAQRNGMEAYDPRHLVTMVRIEGTVEGTSVADLHDKIEALNAAFDPVLAFEEDTSEFDPGYMPFTFSVPTEDSTHYPSGLKELEYFGRSMQLPIPRISKFEGDVARFTIILQCVDPRRYLQTDTDVSVSASTTIDNQLAQYKSMPVITIVMSGVGASNFTISNGTDTLTLDLSGLSAGDTVIIDTGSRSILVGGADRMDLWVSGKYPPVKAAWHTWVSTNRTGVSSSTVTYRRAFV